MMPCPKCGTKCPARNTSRATGHVYRNYYCRCGKSFSTQERITRSWDRVNPMPIEKPRKGKAARIAEMLKAEEETPDGSR